MHKEKKQIVSSHDGIPTIIGTYRWSDGQMVRWSDGQMVRWSDGQMVRWSDGQTVHKILPVLFCALLASKGYILLVWLSLRWAKAQVTRFERVKEHITDSQSLHTSYPVYDCVEYSKSESGPPGQ